MDLCAFKILQTDLIRRILNADDGELQRINEAIQHSDKEYFKAIRPRLNEEVKKVYAEQGIIPAIKLYRLVTGSDLRTSKKFVEELCQSSTGSADSQRIIG